MKKNVFTLLCLLCGWLLSAEKPTNLGFLPLNGEGPSLTLSKDSVKLKTELGDFLFDTVYVKGTLVTKEVTVTLLSSDDGFRCHTAKLTVPDMLSAKGAKVIIRHTAESEGFYTTEVHLTSDEVSATIYLSIQIGEEPVACAVPIPMSADSIRTTSAILVYESGAEWNEILINGKRHRTDQLEYHLTGLVPNTDYNWAVRAICAEGDTSQFCGIQSFRTEQDTENRRHQKVEFSLYPNPSTGAIQLFFPEKGIMEVYDVVGRRLDRLVVEGNVRYVLKKSGMYWIRAINAQGLAATQSVSIL